MINPDVTINTNGHVNPTSDLAGIFKAELTMINTNKGTVRCRIYDRQTGELLFSNVDLPEGVIVDDEIMVYLR